MLLGVGVVVLIALGYYLVTLYQVWSTGDHDEARPVDAIVVLGAAQYDGRPAPVLASRLDHVLELYRPGYADTIVVTGGKQPLDRFTEAAASAKYLEARGVPASAILEETERAHLVRLVALPRPSSCMTQPASSGCCWSPTRTTRCAPRASPRRSASPPSPRRPARARSPAVPMRSGA